MARWQDELRRLVDERSGALLDAAHGDVAALEDALVDVYSGRAPQPARPAAGGAHLRARSGSTPTVALVLEDELDGPVALVVAALDRAAARARPGARPRARELRPVEARIPAEAGDDGPRAPRAAAVDDDETVALDVDVASVETRIARARRRRAVAGWATAAVAAAAAAGLAIAVLQGPSDSPRTPTAGPASAVPVVDSPCATPSDGAGEDGPARTLAVSLTSQTSALAPGATWVGTVTTSAGGPGAAAVDLGRLAPLPLLLQDGRVVGTAAEPGTRLAEGPSFAAARFVPCPGASLRPGPYTVVVDQPVRVGATEYRVVSNAVRVRVVTAEPVGYRPAWLAGSPLACGSTIGELAARSEGATPAQLVLDGVVVDATGMTWAFRNAGATTITYSGNRELGLLWLQDGVVRSVGHDLAASDGTLTVPGQTTLRLTARWDTTDYCEPASGAPTYPRHLPAGIYQVYAYARITPPSDTPGSTAWFVQTTGPTYVRVGPDGAVLGR